jgi:hypothetical protein
MTRSVQTTSKMALSSLLLSTALAACTVGADYTPPKAELAPFHNLVDASDTATASRAAARPLVVGFNDPMLVTVGSPRPPRCPVEAANRLSLRDG